MTSDTPRKRGQMGPGGSPADEMGPVQHVPGMAGMPLSGDIQTGNVVQDILTALHRIERRLRRIEEHLGIAPGKETETKTGSTTSRRQAGRGRRESSRTSPYA
jgi:hypothetical protein